MEDNECSTYYVTDKNITIVNVCQLICVSDEPS